MKNNAVVPLTTAAAILTGSTITLLTCIPIRIDGKQYASYRVKDLLIHGVRKFCLMNNVCKFNVQDATLALIQITQEFWSSEIFVVATEGTALGIHREGELINSDDDVDVAVPFDERLNFFVFVWPRLSRLGYKFAKSWYKNTLVTLKSPLGIYVDISFVSLDGSCEHGRHGQKHPCPVHLILNNTELKDVKYHDEFGREHTHTIVVPSEKYLESAYGKHWRIRSSK